MLITGDNLRLLNQQFQADWQSAYDGAQAMYELYSSRVPSGTEENVYGWIAELTGMRKWEGPREVVDVAANDYRLKNEDYEKTVGLDRNKIEDDQFGFFSSIVASLGSAAKWLPDDLCIDMLQNGHANTCWDGQFFFDTDHPVDFYDAGAGTYSNKLVGAGYGLAADPVGAYAAARAAMMKFKGESGRPLKVIPNLMIVPPDLERYALQVANAQLTAQAIKNVAGAENVGGAAVTNVYQGTITVVVEPRLTDQTVWYLMATNRAVKPIIFQDRKSPQFVARTAPTDDNVFRAKRFEYGVDARCAAGYSLPFLAVRCSPA